MVSNMSPALGRASSNLRLGAAVSAAAGLFLLSGSPAFAQVPKEFQGDWSSNPPRCEQVNGEVDLLTVEKDSLSYYEVGCEKLANPRKGRLGSVTFAAVCFKGGSPDMKGEVELSHKGDKVIQVKLIGFFWTAPAFQTFHRCQRPR